MPSGKLNLEVEAKTGKAVAGMKKLAKGFKNTEISMKTMAKGAGVAYLAVKGLDAIFGVLRKGLGLVTKALKDSTFELAKHGDRMAKQARMVGVTAEQYQVFEFAAERAGTSVKHVSNGLKKLGRVMVDAQNGSQQIKETFAALDIELTKSDGTLRDVSDVFMDMADRSMAMGESAERTGVLMLLLGRSGTEMANLMERGGKGIEDMGRRLRELNGIMGEDLLASSEAMIDAQADLKFAFRGVQIAIGKQLIPELVDLTNQLVDWTTRTDWEQVKEFSTDLLDAAVGASRFADALFRLQGIQVGLFGATKYSSIGDAEELRYTKARDAAREHADALEDGLEPIDKSASLMWQLGESVASASSSVFGLVGGIDPATAGMSLLGQSTLLATTSSVNLEDAWIGLANQAAKTNMSGVEFLRVLRAGTDATNEQISALLELQSARVAQASAEALLAEVFQKRASVAAEADAAEQKRIATAKERGEEIKKRIARLEEERKAEAKKRSATAAWRKRQAKQSRDAIAAARAEEKALKDLDKARMAILARGLELEEQAYEAFYKTDLTDLTAKWSAEHDLISAWLSQREDRYDESLRLRALADKRYFDGKQELRLEEQTKEREALNQTMSDAAQVGAAVSSLAMTLAGFAQEAYEDGDANARAAAVALFHVAQAAALATAIVNTAVAVSGALANPPAPPYSIPQAVAAGIMGAAQIATIVGTSIKGIGDAGLTSDTLRKAGMSNHSAIIMRNDETVLDPVGTKHITEMLAIQKAQMQGGGGEQNIHTTVEIDGRVLGESVDTYLIRQKERGLEYSNRVRQEFV